MAIHDTIRTVAAVAIYTPLSRRESDVLRLLAAGKTDRVIAGELSITEKTTKAHVKRVYQKMGIGQGEGYNPRVLAALFVARGGLEGGQRHAGE